MRKPHQDNSKLQLLIVEDNPGDRDLLTEHLDMAVSDCEVSHCGTLAEAVDVLGRHARFDAILLDLNLPGKSR